MQLCLEMASLEAKGRRICTTTLLLGHRGAQGWGKSGHPESNQGPSDCCSDLQSDALPTELSPAHVLCHLDLYIAVVVGFRPYGREGGTRPSPCRRACSNYLGILGPASGFCFSFCFSGQVLWELNTRSSREWNLSPPH